MMFFRKNKSRAFTLLETMIAVGIVLGLVAIGIASYRRYQWGINITNAVNTLASDIKLTQQMAIQNPCPDRTGNVVDYKVDIKTRGYVINIYHDDNGDDIGEALQKVVKTVYFPSGVELQTPASASVTYQQSGTPVEGNVQLKIVEKNLNKIRIINISSKGAVSLE